MGRLKRVFCAILGAAMLVSATPIVSATTQAEPRAIVIDGSKAEKATNKLYRGIGMVSGNNSSRLLLDYKTEHPDRYWEILNHMFGPSGVGATHLKVEMGSDINSSSGTEPSVKRSADEVTDVTRGAGYQLAADAKTVNPDLTLDMLWWSEPAWVAQSEDVYDARYQWYKETLDAAFNTYNIKFDYVSANRNERMIDATWMKYLSKRLKEETDSAYDFSKIKIVGADESSSWGISRYMAQDEELRNAIDVIGSHYTSHSDKTTKQMADEYGKEIWFSEASSPMSYSAGTYRFDGTGSGLSDINGLLDIANRMITMYPEGDMTLHSFQPAIAGYYDGVTYAHKQLITANTPWNGYYSLDNGYYMTQHFSQFFSKGWTYINDACHGDGVKGGDGHAIVDAVYSYLTASDPTTGDYSTVITNTTTNPIEYNFSVSNLDKASSNVDVWETRGPDTGSYDENYFQKIQTIEPVEQNGTYNYTVTVKPYSIVTVSTLAREEQDYVSPKKETNTLLSLPYTDGFEYKDYDSGYLASRGFAPRYTTDEGGAFEVEKDGDNNILRQKITPETLAKEWGKTPNPTTNFGDDRWFNYQVAVDVKFTKSEVPEENYTGVGLRYNLADSGRSGYSIQVFEGGSWIFRRNNRIKLEGKIENFDSTKWINLKVIANQNNIKVLVDDVQISDITDEEAMLSAGRAAIYSSYNQNAFDNITVNALDTSDDYHITRYDNMDLNFEYSDGWEHATMSSFKNYKRTISTGGSKEKVTFKFNGTGFAVTGATEEGAAISVKIDDEMVKESLLVPAAGSREVTYSQYDLAEGEHTVELTVVAGNYSVDGLEVKGEPIKEPVVDDEPSETESGSQESSSANGSGDKTVSDYILPIVIGVAVLVIGGVIFFVLNRRKNKE